MPEPDLDLTRELERVAAEERELVLDHLDHDDALDLGLALVELARTRQLPIAVDVERCGQRLFHYAAAGTSPDNAAWIERKKNLVKRLRRSSYAVGLELRAEGRTLDERWGMPAPDFAPHGGCFPLVVRGVGFVGTVAVSGLPQRADHDLVVEALRIHLQRGRD